MITKEDKTKKICAIYASDFHLEMMILPYIKEKIQNNENVIVMLDKNILDSVKTVLSKINLDEDTKEQILKLNWEKDDVNKFELIKQYLKTNDSLNIFIKGKENYIDNINSNIREYIQNTQNSNINIINCYQLEEIYEKIQEITNEYDCILNTNGEKTIKYKYNI